MMRTRAGRWTVTLALLLGVIAPLAGGVGTGGTGVMSYFRGALTRSTGIVVDGVTFDASQATITINGEDSRSDDLKPGMIAGVAGHVNSGKMTGVAQSINVGRTVFGQAVRVGTGGTGVMAVGVYIVPRTDVVFVGINSLDDVATGDTLDVYGYSDGVSGEVDATRIERVAPAAFVELHGIVLTPTSTTFVLQGVTVDYSAAQLVGFTGSLAAGDRVAVRGTANGQGIAALTVTAESTTDLRNGAKAEVEDAISALIAPGMFVVDDFEVDAKHASFSGGTAADLVAGRVVHVEGTIVNDVLIAKSVEFDDGESDDSETGDGASGEADVDGPITSLTSATLFVVGHTSVDAGGATFENGQAGDVAIGKEVRAVGKRNGQTLLARRVTFVQKGSTSAEIEGKVSAVTAPGVFVLRSITVDARAATIRGGSLSKVRVGTGVQATGVWQGAVLVAHQLTLDD